MKRSQIFIAFLIMIVPIFSFSPGLLRWVVAEEVIVDVTSIESKTYLVHKSGQRTRFTIDGTYGCAERISQCSCRKFWLNGDDYVSGDGKIFIQELRNSLGQKRTAYAAVIFGQEFCWFETNFEELKSWLVVFSFITFLYLSLCISKDKDEEFK